MLLYTFTIHDEDRDVPYFNCVADNERHAIAKCRSLGYKEFSLSETRPLEQHETAEFVNASIAKNPFVGPQWTPFIEAAAIYIEARELNKREPTWSIDVFRISDDNKLSRPFFIQGLVEMDGSMHLEISGDLNLPERFTEVQIEQLKFMGWDKFEPHNIYFIEFEPGWVTQYVGERIVEALCTVHAVTESDFFGFGINSQILDEIRSTTEMVDITVNHHNGIPSWFALPASKAISWAEMVRRDQAAKEESEKGVEEQRPDPEPAIEAKGVARPERRALRTDDVEHSTESDTVYGTFGHPFPPFGCAAYRRLDGRIVLEVMPKIFLEFNPYRRPEIEDFFYDPTPWLSIPSSEFERDPIGKNFHPDSEIADFLLDFARSVYDLGPIESAIDGKPRAERVAALVAAGIFGDSRFHSGQRMLDRALETRDFAFQIARMRGAHFGSETSADIAEGDDESLTLVEIQNAAAWLAQIPELGQFQYYRKFDNEDLLGWGVDRDVIELLVPLVGTENWGRLEEGPYTVWITEGWDTRAGYINIRLAMLEMRYGEIAGKEGLKTEAPHSGDAKTALQKAELSYQGFDSALAWIVEERAALYREGLNPYSRNARDVTASRGEGIQFSPGLRKSRLWWDVPSWERMEAMGSEVSSRLFGRSPHGSSKEFAYPESQLALQVLCRAVRTIVGDQHSVALNLPTEIELAEMVKKSPYPQDTDFFLFADLPSDYVDWMADRVVTTIHMLRADISARGVANRWDERPVDTWRLPCRMDEIAFVSILLYAATRLSGESESAALLSDFTQPTRWLKDVLSMFNDWRGAEDREDRAREMLRSMGKKGKLVATIESSFITQAEILVSTGSSTSVNFVPGPNGVKATASVHVTGNDVATLVAEAMFANGYHGVVVELDRFFDLARYSISGYVYVGAYEIEQQFGDPQHLENAASRIETVLRLGEAKQELELRFHSSSAWALAQLLSDDEEQSLP